MHTYNTNEKQLLKFLAYPLLMLILAGVLSACTSGGSAPIQGPIEAPTEQAPLEADAQEGLADSTPQASEQDESFVSHADSTQEGNMQEGSAAESDKADTETNDEVDIRSLPAGTKLSFEQISSYGEDACFTVEEIDDELFERIYGLSFKEYCTVPRENLRYIRVLHSDAEGEIYIGELVMNVSVAQEVCDIFHELYRVAYPIEKMHLVDDYGADDNASMADNNTSAFNFRTVPNSSSLSNHAYGLAIDINPYYNPYVPNASTVMPEGTWEYTNRTGSWTYKIEEGDPCHKLFTEAGFRWGGYWAAPDYQHFDRN